MNDTLKRDRLIKAAKIMFYHPRPLKEGLTETLQHEMKLLGMK